MRTARAFTVTSLIVVLLAVPGCQMSHDDSANPAPVLLFNGTGSSVNDVTAVETLLRKGGLRYVTAGSSQLNAMAVSDLARRRLLIVPGGNYIEIGRSLRPETAAAVRNAVRGGLNYLGICAGGLLAGQSPYNGFDLTSGVRFGFYSVVEQGIHKAPVAIAFPESPSLEHYWEDGPEFTGWGAVVAKYPDGKPAIVQGRVDKGWMVLVGTHPEAPANWRDGMRFSMPAGADNAYAAALIDAAFNATPLPHF